MVSSGLGSDPLHGGGSHLADGSGLLLDGTTGPLFIPNVDVVDMCDLVEPLLIRLRSVSNLPCISSSYSLPAVNAGDCLT